MVILRESFQSREEISGTDRNQPEGSQARPVVHPLVLLPGGTTGTARGVPSAPPEAHACSLTTHLAPTTRQRAGGCRSTHALNRRPYPAPGRSGRQAGLGGPRHPVPISGHHRDKGKKDTGCCTPSLPAAGPRGSSRRTPARRPGTRCRQRPSGKEAPEVLVQPPA